MRNIKSCWKSEEEVICITIGYYAKGGFNSKLKLYIEDILQVQANLSFMAMSNLTTKSLSITLLADYYVRKGELFISNLLFHFKFKDLSC